MELEGAIKEKFGKNTTIHPLPRGGYLVILDKKKLKMPEEHGKTKLSANIVHVPGKRDQREHNLYATDGCEPIASIVAEKDQDYLIIYDCKKNKSLLKELLNILMIA